jgi:hypothetical protein
MVLSQESNDSQTSLGNSTDRCCSSPWANQYLHREPDHYRDKEYHKLADVPANRALGTRMLGIVDNQLILYLQSLPEKTRWRRIPYFNNKLLLRSDIRSGSGSRLSWRGCCGKDNR